jgi:glycine amidinotransferase
MIHTHTEWGKLKEVIVGRELELPMRMMDITFKIFYNSNLQHTQFTAYNDYRISPKLIQERIDDLDGLAKALEDEGIVVKRPNVVDKSVLINTPNFKSVLSSASNVRDLTLTYKNKIIETPPLVRGRYFENNNLINIFKEHFMSGSEWVRAPNVLLSDETFDSDKWDNDRDLINVSSKWDLGIDAAQYLKLGTDVFCNISTYNHALGSKWVNQMLGEGVTVHMIDSMIDNHLDGTILPLRPGVFLVNESTLSKPIKEYLPDKFKDWKFISVNEGVKHQKNYDTYNTPFVQLSSYRGMDMNVLSIDENTVLVNSDATSTISLLKEEGFRVIPIQLRHCELFGGGIHCSTLDTIREDEFKDYTL